MKVYKMVCRNCNATEFKTLVEYDEWLAYASHATDERAKMVSIVEDNNALQFGDIVQCDTCKFLSVEKVPSEQALGEFYRAYYANASYAVKEDKKIKRATSRFKRLDKFIKSDNKTFLDVGCNLGYAVKAAANEGYKATGIDVDDEAVAKAKANYPDLTFIYEDVQAHTGHSKQYSLVYCTEVIEHLRDFKSFARNIASLVEPGGILFLTTPEDHFIYRVKGLLHWAELKPPEHLQWFRKKHLKALFSAEGLDVCFLPGIKPGIRMLARKKAVKP